MRPDTLQCDIAVSGAGIVGLTAACLFARQGMTVCVLCDGPLPDWNPDTFHPRVSTLNMASIRIFEHLDAWRAIMDRRTSPFTRMEVWEHGTGAQITFDARDMGARQLGVIVENDAVIATLQDRLHENHNVTVLENAVLEHRFAENAGLILRTGCGKTIICQLLVGADGAHSATRVLCAIPGTYLDFEQHAIVTALETADHHAHTAWQAFLPSGPAALLPLADGRCSLVWSCDNAVHETLMILDDPDFCERISDIFATRLGRAVGCETRHAFPLRQHHADTYVARRTVLVGDAAHLIHPLAGLGANIGIQDAAALSQIVETARSRGRDFHSHSVLRRYERWRKGENALVLNTTRGFKTLYGSGAKTLIAARQGGLRIAENLPLLKRQLARYAMGIGGDLPDICKPATSAYHV